MGLFRRREKTDPFVAPAGPPAGSPPSESFAFTVDDVFTITGRGTVVTGTLAYGSARVGDQATLVGSAGQRAVTITAIEAFRKRLEVARAGEPVGLLLRGVERGDVARGDQIVRQ